MLPIRTSIIALAVAMAFSSHAFAADAGFPDLPTGPSKTEKPVPTGSFDSQVRAANQKAAGEKPLSMPPLPQISPKTPAEIRGESYESAAEAALPLTPDQIRKLHKLLDDQQRAKSEMPFTPPKPVVSPIQVSLDPGVVPPVIRLASGFVSSLVFTDATGAAWPIVKPVNGNPDVIQVEQPDPKGNVLTVSPEAAYIHGNISVFLVGMSTPVAITVVSGQKEVDYRADMMIQARGPNAVSPVIQADMASGKFNPIMVKVLDGTMPDNAQLLSTSDPAVRAWKMGGKIYFRSRMTVLSPAWSDHVNSPDGMHAYEMTDASVVLVSSDGNPVQIKIGGPKFAAMKGL